MKPSWENRTFAIQPTVKALSFVRKSSNRTSKHAGGGMTKKGRLYELENGEKGPVSLLNNQDEEADLCPETKV